MSILRIMTILLLVVAVTFGADTPVTSLRITELHYHPLNPTADEIARGGSSASDDKYEFIEFTNLSASPLDVSGCSIKDAFTYAFPPGSIIPGHGRVVVANDAPSFIARYGAETPVFGVFSKGNLSNSSEAVTLLDAAAATIQGFTYLDSWYPGTDGISQQPDGGYSLKLTPAAYAAGPWNDPASWAQSATVNGSPGYDDGEVSGNVHFSKVPGVFVDPFSLTLSADVAGSVIRYTTDGSLPTATSAIYTIPIAIAATSQIRAFVKGPHSPSGPITSAYYLKLTAAAGSFASHMPVVVVDTFGAAVPDTTSTAQVVGALVILPPATAGAADTLAARTPDLVARIGVAERGSSSATFPKQSLSLEAWDENNQDASFAPMGMPAGEDWALVGPYKFDSAFIRDAVAYEMSARIGRYASRLRIVEVFAKHVVGDITPTEYQGIFLLMERVKRGGNRIDVEKLTVTDTAVPAIQGGYIVKVDNPTPGEIGFTVAEGTGQRQGVVMVYPDGATAPPEQVAWIKGYMDEFVLALRSPNFINPNTGRHYSDYIDVDSWIDHHIINLVFKNTDALRKSAYMYKPRNGKLFAGPVWDFDRCADSKDISDDDPYTIDGTTGTTRFFGNPWWSLLFTDPEFMQRYTDRIQALLVTHFAVPELHDVIDLYADPLNAILLPETQSPAERDAARWPGLNADGPRPFTQVDVTLTGYLAEVVRMKAWLQNRVEFLKGYWPAPAVFSRPGGTVELGHPLTISASVGTIYYTLDGSDPRVAGGAPAPTAMAYAGPIIITGPVTITARVLDGTRWSSPTSGHFIISSAIPLRITEIMYNPLPDNDPASDDQAYEYIELKNVSVTDAIDLTGLKVAGGVDYTFTAGTLAPRALVLLVADRASFEARYGTGRPVAGIYAGRLSNGGERLRLLGVDDAEIQSFTYQDTWYPVTDGQGPSLVINDPFGAKPLWDVAAGWRPSYSPNGTPGEDENRAPVATGEEFAIDLNQPLTVTVAALTANDVDPDAFDELAFMRVANPVELGAVFATTKGTLSLAMGAATTPGTVITYTPPANFYGTDYFSYQVSDLYGAASNVVSVRITVKTPPVRINEFWTHTDTPNADGLEICNPTAYPVNIGGWRVAKTPTGAGSNYDFPSNTVIPANGLLVVDCDATDGNGAVTIPGDWRTTLSPRSGALYLLPKVDGIRTTPISGTTFPVSLDGQSFGYYRTSDGRVVYPIERKKTINAVNTGPRVGPVVITEVMYAPQPGEHQFIEIQNTSGGNVRLDKSMGVLGETKTFGWRIDGVTFTFPPGFILAPGQMCVIVDGSITADDYRLQRNIPPSVPLFNFSGVLKLAGNRLALQQAENFDSEPTLYWLTNDLVDFKNGGLWPSAASGSGRSIVRVNKAAYGDDAINWTLSQDVGGSPGTADGASPPNAADDAYALNPGSLLVMNAPGVLANDTDANRDAITAVLKSGVTHGTLILNANGSFQYRPAPGFAGIDRFIYQARDATSLLSQDAIVSLNVGMSQLDARIMNATDDAEEHEDGVMDLSSTDLELTYDAKVDGAQPRGNQWIGVRFTALAIPRGAHITTATLQFTATGEVPANDLCQLTFWAQDADGADTFHDSAIHEISQRPRTAASVPWQPTPWLVAGEAGAAQCTPNLAAVVQQVVDRSGWMPGNPMAIIITGTGKRVAEALDGAKPESCVRLHVEWDLGGPYANPDTYTATQGQTLTVSAAGGILANDGTLGAQSLLTASLVTAPANGTLVLQGNGAFSYTPVAHLTGRDQFTYQVSDGSHATAPQTVTLNITTSTGDYATGLDYEYWWCRLSSVNEITGLDVPVKTGTVATFDLAPRDQDDNFAFRYRGFITLPTAGAYTFYLKSDEGSALWIDGTLVVDNDGIHSSSAEKSGTVAITTTGRHAIELRYFEREGTQSLSVSYAGPGIVKQTIPAAVLSRSTRERVVGVNDAYSVAMNGTLSVTVANSVLKNDVSVLGTPLSAVLVGTPTLGTFTTTLAANGTFVYKPTAGVEGYDSFTYRCSDGVNVSALVTVAITVGSPDAAQPVAVPDHYTTNAGKTLVVGVADGLLVNDTDPNGDALKAYLVKAPSAAQGSLVGNKVELDGRFTFVPTNGFIGTVTFTYKCNDGVFNSESRTVTIEVLPPSPLDEYVVQRTGSFPAIGKDLSGITWNPDTQTYFVIANDTSTLGDGRKVQIFEYLPDLATLVRGIRIQQIPAVSPFDDKDAWDAEDIAYLGNGEFAIGLEGHLAGGQRIPSRVVITRINATTTDVVTTLGQCISITLPPVTFDNNGLEGLTYDRNGNGGLGVFYATQEKNPITLWRFNRPADRTTLRTYDAVSECALTIPFDAAVLLEDRFIISDLSGIWFDDRTGRLLLVSDEGQALVDVDLTGRVIGQFSLPTSLQGGADQYEGIALGKDYKLVVVSEPNVFTELVNVTLPVADDDTYSMPDNTSLTIAAGNGVLINDRDGNNQPLTAVLKTAPEIGVLALAANGGFTYAPPSGFSGAVHFAYQATDGSYLSQVATVTINVSSLDHPPAAQNDSFTLAEDSTFTSTTSILLNDADPDGDPRFAVVETLPLHGALTVKADGTFTYRPLANFSGTDSFTYRCRAGSAESAPATVTLIVTPVNDPPVAVPDSMLVTAEDVDLVVAAPGVLANDYDIDGDALTAEVTQAPAHGTLALAADGSFTYHPDANFHGPDGFRYRCRDAVSASLDVAVPITVTPVNDAPVAADDAFTTNEDVTLSVPAPGVLANDQDADGDPLIIGQVMTQPQHGTLTLATNGGLTYVPAADWNGADSFTYTAFDGVLESAPARVVLTILPVDDAPRTVADSYWTRIGRPLTVPVAQGVLANDVEVDGDTMTATVKTAPTHGMLTLASDGSFTYVPAPGYLGSDSFVYTATAGTKSTTATVTLLVKPLDVAPTVDAIVADAAPVTGTSVGLSVAANDADHDPAPLTYTWQANGPASVVFDGNGGIGAARTVAHFSAAGTYQISVVVSDGELSATTNVPVVVVQVAQGLVVTPAAVTIANGRTRTLTVSLPDQFGAPVSPMPIVSWTVLSGTVTITASGELTAPASGTAPSTIQAAMGAYTATIPVTVIQPSTGVGLTRYDYTAAENSPNDTASFRLYRASSAIASPLPVTLVWSGTATPGDDYQALPTAVTIPAGAVDMLITVVPIDDQLVEGTETVIGTIVPDVNFTIAKASDQIIIVDDEKPLITPSLKDGTGTENGSDGITLRLSRYPVKTGGATLTVTPVFAGTATLGVDYLVPATSFTFTGTVTTIDIPITRVDDALVEGSETIVFSVPTSADYDAGAPVTARLGDDERPEVSLKVTDALAAEPDDTGVITVTRWPVSSLPLAVAYTVSGDVNRIQPLSGTVQIPANAASATITIVTGDDSVMELPGQVTITLAPGGAYQLTGIIQGTVSIADDDYRPADTGAGSRPGLDYAFYTTPTRWTALPDFRALTPVKKGTVAMPDLTPRTQVDSYGFVFTGYLEVPTDGPWTLSVTSDDGSRLWLGDMLVVDNDGRHSAAEKSSIPLLLRAGKHAIRLEYFQYSSVSLIAMSWQGPGVAKQAIPASRFFLAAQAASFPPVVGAIAADAAPVTGSTVGLSVVASDPDHYPAPLTYTWQATGPATVSFDGNGTTEAAHTTAHVTTAGTYQITVAVSDGDSTVTATTSVLVIRSASVSLARSDDTAAENIPADTASFLLSRSSTLVASPLPVTIVWSGTATAGTDYQTLPSVVTIPAGAVSTLITVIPKDDELIEGTETVIGTIVPDGTFTISQASDRILILDDEKPLITPRLVDGSGSENGTNGITLGLNRYPVKTAGATLTVTPGYAGTATLGVDYLIPATSFTFAGTVADINIPITRVDDAVVEGTETIILSVPGDASYEAGAPVTARLGDDEKPEVSLKVTDGTATEPDDVGIITVSRWPVTAQPLDVTYTVVGNLELIQPLSGTVQIPANATSATIIIATGDDGVIEMGGKVTITLTPGSYQLTGTTQGTVTILDNDLVPADAVAGTRPGLDYAYYIAPAPWTVLPDFSQLVPVQTGTVAAPDISPRTRVDRFGFVFTGFLQIPADGQWTFFTTTDDGSRLWIGDRLVVDNDGAHGPVQVTSAPLPLRAGKHAMRLEYFQGGGGYSFSASWQGPGVAKQAIPASACFRPVQAPIAIADAYRVTVGQQLVVAAAAGVLANDSDPEGHPLSAELVAAPANGTLVLAAHGGFTFTAPAVDGPLTFTYRAGNGVATSPPTTVTITVQLPAAMASIGSQDDDGIRSGTGMPVALQGSVGAHGYPRSGLFEILR